MRSSMRIRVILTMLLAVSFGVRSPSGAGAAPPQGTPPNILFVIMDDVGIDQMQAFGYGGETAPSMPTIDRLAGRGVRFHNTWSMPACTPSRAVLFDGRYPLRTNVYGALGPDDLANSMVSPFEMTAPKVLAKRGYESALFGKFHLALQGNNPAGLTMPHALGWDFFHGWLDETGDPSSIDTTAGGVAPEGTWPCGFVPGADAGGVDSGACYQPDGTCEELSTQGRLPAGRLCRDRGGILDPGASCQPTPPETLDFDELSGHYVSPLVINYPDGSYEPVPASDPRARRFRARASVDAAIEWISQRPADRPWMATVSFSSAHTPVMQLPADPTRAELPQGSDLDCADVVDQRVLTNMMIESIDQEVGRLLVETGIARRTKKGRLVYRPKRSNTMVIVVGDNGSLGSVVKVPFDPGRSKGTAYQTGVWVPLVVAGPVVRRPGRAVAAMVNVADVYQLFAEIAGLDVHALVPRPIDSQPLRPYLENPRQPSIRTSNFTQVGPNLQANGGMNGPCQMGGTSCSQIPVSKSVCEDNNGIWWGVGADDPSTAGPQGLKYCCEVDGYLASQGRPILTLQPNYSTAIRNDRYKIVQNTTNAYTGSPDDPCAWTTETEFYEIDEVVPVPKLDREGDDLLQGTLTPEQQENFDALSAELSALLQSSPACPADGNLDGVVDNKDVGLWAYYAESWGGSSVYDVDLNGITDTADRTLVVDATGVCAATP